MLKTLSMLLAAAVLVLVSSSPVAAQDCPAGTTATPVKAKIFNSGVGAGETLGVASVVLPGGNKFKCALHGVDNGSAGQELRYLHTLACDDQLEIFGQILHSQVTLETEGNAAFQACPLGSPSPYYGPFEETSVPLFGYGQFANIAGGELLITGTLNCLGAIDMKADGYFCAP